MRRRIAQVKSLMHRRVQLHRLGVAIERAESRLARLDRAALRALSDPGREELHLLRAENQRLRDRNARYSGDAALNASAMTELARQVNTDELTGAASRPLMRDRLAHELALARRLGTLVGLLFIDLDGFKAINDGLGHGVGDQVLVIAANRLRAAVREVDTVCRYGGDEFVVVLAGLKNAGAARTSAEHVLAALCQPCQIDGHSIEIEASLGLSVFPRDAQSAEGLLRHADQAMYRIKQGGMAPR